MLLKPEFYISNLEDGYQMEMDFFFFILFIDFDSIFLHIMYLSTNWNNFKLLCFIMLLLLMFYNII